MDWIEWVWLGDRTVDANFCGGIYFDTKTNKYRTVLSDLKNLKFNEVEEARLWLRAKKLGGID